jgi:tRNA(Ile)-lysidine synthase
MSRADAKPPRARYDCDELMRLMAPLSEYDRVALAVSGGSDSVGLMVLATRWATLVPRSPQIIVVTIDHGLRAGSDTEAAFVAAQASRLGLDHETLLWSGPKPKSGLQEAARAARYNLLAETAARLGADAIVTAHTADDQAETMLMRLARGSGLDGLAGIPERALWAGFAILRPLLSERRGRLRAMLRASGLRWVDDPSNADARFERVRVRQLLRTLAPQGIDAARLALSARRLSRARAALDAQTTALLAAEVRLGVAGSARLARDVLEQAPVEIGLRALGAIIPAIGGQAIAPRLAKLEALHAALTARPSAARDVRLTLGGVIISALGNEFEFCREYGRIGEAASVLIAPGETRLWDGRFWISARSHAPAKAIIAPLGKDGAARLSPASRRDCPRAALLAMPGIYRAKRLVAAPPLVLQDAADNVADDCYSIRFAHDFAARTTSWPVVAGSARPARA